MGKKELGVIEPIKRALKAAGYKKPTPIQQQAIPILLKGKDLLGCAQTGTGKTAAFGIPILQHLYLANHKGHRKVRALIVTPTRELAIQIGDSFTTYGKYTGLRNTVIFGGVKQASQTRALNHGVDILVATPGRLLDLMEQGLVSLKDIEYFVLDEADRMLDMGFIHDIRKIIAVLPKQRQSLFFSATMPPDIVELSRAILGDFEQITITPDKPTAEKVDQSLYYVSKKDKIKLLVHLMKTQPMDSALVFSRTKHGANKIVRQLVDNGIHAEAIHGNKSQVARQRALGNFKEGKTNVLVATDIAARGIDVKELSHVVNYDLPNIPETYVHRIGRTGRADASGIALSFCMAEERPYLKDIQKLIKQQIPVVVTHPYVDSEAATAPQKEDQRRSEPNKRHDKRKPNHKHGKGKGSSGGQHRQKADRQEAPKPERQQDHNSEKRQDPKPAREYGQKHGNKHQAKRRRGNDIQTTPHSKWPLG